jgi:hypothetical protein
MKIGRNELCPCGSGRKYKKCCLFRDADVFAAANTKLQRSQTTRDLYGVDEDDDSDAEEFLANAANNFHMFLLKGLPHIKEYKKIRRMHGRILSNMLQYYYDGKFEQKIIQNPLAQYPSWNKETSNADNVYILLESDFDMETRLGSQAFIDMLAYKTSPTLSCIAEEFIKTKHYRLPEKIEFLHCMLDAKLGLFDVSGIDSGEGYAYIKEVFTGREYKITDLGLSGSSNYDRHYIYTRILTYHGISYSTGLNLLFSKKDAFIQDFIARHEKDYLPFGDFIRFTELYNRFSKDPDRIKVIGNSF